MLCPFEIHRVACIQIRFVYCESDEHLRRAIPETLSENYREGTGVAFFRPPPPDAPLSRRHLKEYFIKHALKS